MKLFGFSVKDLPDTAKLIYVGLFAAIVIAALYYGLSNLDTDKKSKSSNKRRSPKKDKKDASPKTA